MPISHLGRKQNSVTSSDISFIGSHRTLLARRFVPGFVPGFVPVFTGLPGCAECAANSARVTRQNGEVSCGSVLVKCLRRSQPPPQPHHTSPPPPPDPRPPPVIPRVGGVGVYCVFGCGGGGGGEVVCAYGGVCRLGPGGREGRGPSGEGAGGRFFLQFWARLCEVPPPGPEGNSRSTPSYWGGYGGG
jgi:hypothetical protein